jgi:uncharacterized protein (DUF1015 family)
VVEIEPFRGLRYAESLANPGVFAPPYDVISPAKRQALLARSPHNIVHLDLGPTPPDPNWYAQAAHTLHSWLVAGVLRRDDTSAFYGYRQRFSWGHGSYTRTGFMARVHLRPWGQGIHRHELTRNQPKADRLQLMRALDMQTSPVFGLFADPAGAAAAWLRQSAREPGAVEINDDDGVRHTLWRITEPQIVAGLQDALRATDVVIADGHHRYETALALAAERRATRGPSPADDVLMHLTPLDDPGLLVLATHRVVRSCALSVEVLLAALAQRYDVTPTTARLTEAIQGQSGAFGLRLPDQSYVLCPIASTGDHTSSEPELDVVALQQNIMEPVLGIAAARLADADLTGYTIDEHEAARLVDAGEAALALIINPTPLDAIWRTALRGDVMPQKSTFFHPKLLTGLVMNPLWD